MIPAAEQVTSITSMTSIAVQVRRKRQEAPDIASFELVRADGAALPGFSAGAHVDVTLPGGVVRQYSLCNDDGDPAHYRIAVLRDPRSRGGSIAVHEIVEGDTLTISAPKNHFPLVHARRTLLFAGGIGITPLLCMAQRLSVTGADFELHYCNRSAERAAFLDEIAVSSFASNLRLHLDDGPPAQRLDAEHALGAPAPDVHAYVCGPAGFIDHVLSTALQCGWSQEQLHREYFGVAPTAATPTGGAFQVRIASSGLTCDVPEDRSVVEVLRAQGIDIPTSCEQGVCGTCITRVLQGECDHRDFYFTHEEHARQDQFTPCCSRAKSAMLVLDL